VITLEGVSYRYRGAPAGSVLERLSLAIRDGEWVAIAGANGSGKTTLCKLIAGLSRPDEGTIEIDGRAAVDALRSARGEPPVSIAFQDPDSQFVTSSVRDEILFGMENLGLDEPVAESRCAEALSAFDLERYRARNPHTLSGGEKQRLMLAALSSMGPRHLVLDEPFSYLDDDSRRSFLSGLRGAFKSRGRTVVWASVSREEIDLADRVLFLGTGGLIFDGRPADLEGALSKDVLENALVGTAAPNEGRARERSSGCGAGDSAGAKAGGSETARVEARLGGTVAAVVPSAPIHIEHALFSPEGGDFELRVPAFDLLRGERAGVLGPSGSGKTTFLLGCSGLLPPRAGTVSLFGRPVKKRRDFPAGRIAYLFQTPEQGFFAPTVREEVALGHRSFHGAAGERDAVKRALEGVGLSPERFLDRSPFHLSEGEKRLVALASVLILDAPVLLLDEPTIFLDGRARRVLLDVLGSLAAAGTSVLIASHDRPLLDSFAERSILIEKGKIL
jgi:energy-coupling factor transporter ATP-binding protein EcfA2